jgi:hypothetical protein
VKLLRDFRTNLEAEIQKRDPPERSVRQCLLSSAPARFPKTSGDQTLAQQTEKQLPGLRAIENQFLKLRQAASSKLIQSRDGQEEEHGSPHRRTV